MTRGAPTSASSRGRSPARPPIRPEKRKKTLMSLLTPEDKQRRAAAIAAHRSGFVASGLNRVPAAPSVAQAAILAPAVDPAASREYAAATSETSFLNSSFDSDAGLRSTLFDLADQTPIAQRRRIPPQQANTI